MDRIYIEGSIVELSNIFNYIISVLILQIGLIFIKYWYLERKKKKLSSSLSLSFGIYYIFLSIGTMVFFLTIYHQISPEILILFQLLSILIRGIGVVIFSITVELYFKNLVKSRFSITISCLILLILIPFLINIPYFPHIVIGFNILQLTIPFLFTIYFIKNTYGKIKKKLRISMIGIILLFIGLFFTTLFFSEIIGLYISNLSFIIFISKFVSIIGIAFLIYGYTGYSFLLEVQWKKNLISFHIIDTKRNSSIYNKIFHPGELKSSELFTGGISSMNKLINQFTTSNKDVDVIDFEDKYIVLEYGKEIMTAMIVRRLTKNLRYILKEVNLKFENDYWNYLEDSDKKKLLQKETNIRKSVGLIIEKYLTLK
ncbi:MAG: hypothetical protein GF329_19550 [Candidatus Lokiarchaeota archaeon]|nr:hypothetical protein [Candidatus Lokiarchaeota archaeon]